MEQFESHKIRTYFRGRYTLRGYHHAVSLLKLARSNPNEARVQFVQKSWATAPMGYAQWRSQGVAGQAKPALK